MHTESYAWAAEAFEELFSWVQRALQQARRDPACLPCVVLVQESLQQMRELLEATGQQQLVPLCDEAVAITEAYAQADPKVRLAWIEGLTRALLLMQGQMQVLHSDDPVPIQAEIAALRALRGCNPLPTPEPMVVAPGLLRPSLVHETNALSRSRSVSQSMDMPAVLPLAVRDRAGQAPAADQDTAVSEAPVVQPGIIPVSVPVEYPTAHEPEPEAEPEPETSVLDESPELAQLRARGAQTMSRLAQAFAAMEQRYSTTESSTEVESPTDDKAAKRSTTAVSQGKKGADVWHDLQDWHRQATVALAQAASQAQTLETLLRELAQHDGLEDHAKRMQQARAQLSHALGQASAALLQQRAVIRTETRGRSGRARSRSKSRSRAFRTENTE